LFNILKGVCVNYYYNNKDKEGKVVEFTTKTANCIFTNLLEDYFGYEVKKSGECIKVINGARRKLTKYKIQPLPIEEITFSNGVIKITNRDIPCVFTALNSEWHKIQRPAEYDLN
jgi:hypothetical protein